MSVDPFIYFFILFETEFHSVALVGLELAEICLPLTLRCWGERPVPPCWGIHAYKGPTRTRVDPAYFPCTEQFMAWFISSFSGVCSISGFGCLLSWCRGRSAGLWALLCPQTQKSTVEGTVSAQPLCRWHKNEGFYHHVNQKGTVSSGLPCPFRSTLATKPVN